MWRWRQRSGWCFYKPRKAKHCQQTPRSWGRGMGQILSHSLRGNQPCWHLDLRLLVSRTETIQFLLFKPLCYRSSSRLMQDYLQVLNIMNNAAKNIGIHICVDIQLHFSLVCFLTFVQFFKTCQMIFQWLHYFIFPSAIERFHFLHILANTCYCLSFLL